MLVYLCGGLFVSLFFLVLCLIICLWVLLYCVYGFLSFGFFIFANSVVGDYVMLRLIFA